MKEMQLHQVGGNDINVSAVEQLRTLFRTAAKKVSNKDLQLCKRHAISYHKSSQWGVGVPYLSFEL